MNDIKDRLSGALAKAGQLGASGAKVACAQGESRHVKFDAGRLKDTGSSQSFVFTIDALVNGKRGQATCGDIKELDKTVERAVGLARIGSVAHFDAWPKPAPFTAVGVHSSRTLTLTREKMIGACQEIADMLKAYNPNLFIECAASRAEGNGAMLTTGGVVYESARTGWSISGSVQRTEGTDMLFAYDGRGWCDLNAFFDPRAIGRKILTQLKYAEKTVPPPAGKVKVFLPPEALGMFLSPLFMGINGRVVAKGESPLAGKLGQRVIAPCFTITDFPHRNYCVGAAEVDGDGIPTRTQVLVENGVLQMFLYDLDSAGLAKAEPTGNRGCSPYYCVLERGEKSSDELVRGIDDGLYLTGNLIGFGQSNMMNGDFSCNVGLGYRIQKGEITGRVKDTMIAGNLYDILNGNVDLSFDTNWEGSAPYAVVEGVTVSSKGG